MYTVMFWIDTLRCFLLADLEIRINWLLRTSNQFQIFLRTAQPRISRNIARVARRWLGLTIRIESGDTKDGLKLLRRAVYLEPNHIDALFLLSLLAERAGDFARAKIFEERIERIKQATT